MKKSAAVLAMIALVSTPVFAAQTGGFVDANGKPQATQGGFSGPAASRATVAQAKEMKDDSWVTLEGNIVQRVGDEDYTFRDATGEMRVEIDHKRWNGQNVSPTDKVRLTGELDKDFNAVELDVKEVQKLQ
ncbi:YgiW/YdeI family stress tolerance OB fold protein [Pantoea sp. 1.19]|uniref:YgiW/YdeI family stress tolerance OB fold protein n=1 Tax=Pantoea sp. 1.19 TaxID=1925589 RepID=UPI000948B0F7|nr:YgiW/YdeI family stress tolerance OB fold protein [Pantoea sp. 1.19]